MKATGIVRRIDDLGRVVIPKEIRRTMRIREGDPLEIYTTREGEVIFKKYSLIGGLEDFAAQFCDTLSRSTPFTAAVTDRDAIIAEIDRMVPALKENGGYVFSSDHSIPNSVSLENFKAIVAEIKRVGKY